MDVSMHNFVRIILIWLLCLLSVFLHELGHALGFRISAGKAGWKVIAGSGPRIIGKSKYVFCLIPVGGYFIPEEEPKTNKAKILTLAGGPCLSLLLAVLYGTSISAFRSLFGPVAACTIFCSRYPPSSCISTSFSSYLRPFRFGTRSYAGDMKAMVYRSFMC